MIEIAVLRIPLRHEVGRFIAFPFQWIHSESHPGFISSAKRLASRAQLHREELRLLPRREVPAFVDLIVVDEFGIRPFGPAPRSLVLLAGNFAGVGTVSS